MSIGAFLQLIITRPCESFGFDVSDTYASITWFFSGNPRLYGALYGRGDGDHYARILVGQCTATRSRNICYLCWQPLVFAGVAIFWCAAKTTSGWIPRGCAP